VGGKDVPRVAPARIGTVHRVAQAVVPAVKVYRTTADTTFWKTLPNPLPSRAPRVFLVQEERQGWLRVLLPVRPNHSQGWIHASDVRVTQHDYRMVISLSKHTLTVFKGSTAIMEEPVGLGTATTPTPGGVFYTKELLRPANPKGSFGPYAYGLSGYSQVLSEFLGGDGTLGIHGTNDPSGLGGNVSHGCIRVQNSAITRLAGLLPLGVPVQIMR
jgi:lipoprotein-anchoring transpeptidase ErfK/SrfK